MTKWLSRQESVQLQDAYLHWCLYASVIGKGTEEIEKDKTEQCIWIIEADENVRQVMGRVTLGNFLFSPVKRAYSVSKAPFQCAVRISDLQQQYEASHFLPALNSFLTQHLPNSKLANVFDVFDTYSNIRVLHPGAPHFDPSKWISRLRASPGKAIQPGTRKKPKPARFDTALVLEDPNGLVSEGLQGVRITFYILFYFTYSFVQVSVLVESVLSSLSHNI
jgi:hypothetical protein